MPVCNVCLVNGDLLFCSCFGGDLGFARRNFKSVVYKSTILFEKMDCWLRKKKLETTNFQ